MTLLEVCVDDAKGLQAAIDGDADRIELCSALELGGLTPSPGLVARASTATIPVRAMIRPRPGDFIYDAADIAVMLGDIAAMRRSGLAGVVLGASLPDGRLDLVTLGQLVAAAGPWGKTLHRAFDLVPDLEEAVEQAVSLGFDTILTSGLAPSAVEGLDNLARVHQLAAGRLTVMAGAGVGADTAVRILDRVALGAVHGSCSDPAMAASPAAMRLGFHSAGRRATSATKVAALKAILAPR